MDLKKEVEAIERDQSFEELAVLRRVVMARVKRQQDLVEVSMSTVTTGNSVNTLRLCSITSGLSTVIQLLIASKNEQEKA